MKKLILFAAIASMSTAAMAADPIDAAYDWSGLYLGANGSYNWADADYEHQDVNFFGGPGGTYENDADGLGVGLHAGYNFQAGNIVFGPEVGYEYTWIEGHYDFAQYYNDTTTDINGIFTARARLGLALDRTLLYVAGGYAGASIEAGQDYYAPKVEGRTWSDKEWANGWVIGAGAEYAVTEQFIIGVEYNHYDFGIVKFSGGDSKDVPAHINGDVTNDQVMLRASFKF